MDKHALWITQRPLGYWVSTKKSVKIATGKSLLVSQYGFDCDRSLLTMHFAFHCKEQIASYFKKSVGYSIHLIASLDFCHYF